MDIETCVRKLGCVGVLVFATVGGKGCPQGCVEEGMSFIVRENHCLQCGSCQENCPAEAVRRYGGA